MRSQREGELSAITEVKVYSPEIPQIAQGQRFHILEASIAICAKGEHISGVPGSKSMAGNLNVHNGTWENHIVPKRSFQQAEEARRKHDDMVVGLTHSRGVVEVMLGESACSLEGVSGKTQRDEVTYAVC